MKKGLFDWSRQSSSYVFGAALAAVDWKEEGRKEDKKLVVCFG